MSERVGGRVAATMAEKPRAVSDAHTPERHNGHPERDNHHGADPNSFMTLARLGARWRNTALELDLGDDLLVEELHEADDNPEGAGAGAARGRDSPAAAGNGSGEDSAPKEAADIDSAETKFKNVEDATHREHGHHHESDSEAATAPSSPLAGEPAKMSSVQLKRKQALGIYEASANAHRKRARRRCCRGQAQSTLRLEYINQSLVLSDFFVHWLLSLTWPELIIASVGTSLFFILAFGGMFHWLDGYDSVQESFAISTQTFLTIGAYFPVSFVDQCTFFVLRGLFLGKAGCMYQSNRSAAWRRCCSMH